MNREQLPITDTEYISRFLPEPNIQAYDGIVQIITDWLDDEARTSLGKIGKIRGGS